VKQRAAQHSGKGVDQAEDQTSNHLDSQAKVEAQYEFA